MRNVLAWSALLLWPFWSNAQPHWVRGMGGLGSDHVADVRSDAAGNVYVIGDFSASMNVQGQGFTSNGGRDVFVACFNVAGTLQWLVSGGGAGMDRGIAITLGTGGTVAVTGHFMGTADLFGEVVSSAGGTPDVFVAVLDAATGALQWVRTAGGANGATRPSAITTTTDGRITVTGSFRGDADFGDGVLQSMVDPITLEPGEDVFVASYHADGALAWTVQGAARFTDRGVCLTADAQGHVLVAGQFSDTITFGQSYPNTILNASFLLKLDANGQDVWFRRSGGALFQHVRALAPAPAGGILLAGDLRGTMSWLDGQPHTVASVDAYAYYLLHVDAQGAVVSHEVQGSSSQVSVGAIAVQGDSIAVLGTFNCQFTGLADRYGGGLFMATGERDLFLTRHRLPDLALNGAQQFGGQGAKQAGGITWMPSGDAVFGGGFSHQIILPSNGTMAGTLLAAAPMTGLDGYCGDPFYGRYGRLPSNGLMDGFVARAHLPGRSAYDIWKRDIGGGCDREARQPCILNPEVGVCTDTVVYCSPPPPGLAQSYIHMEMFSAWVAPGLPPQSNIGPVLQFSWSNGGTDFFNYPAVSGPLSCTVTSTPGCPTWTSDVVVNVQPYPEVRLSDSYGVNVDVPQTEGAPLVLCSELTIWPSTMNGVAGYQWTLDGVPIDGLEVQVLQPGMYRFRSWNEAGCITFNDIVVIDGAPSEMPNITGVDHVYLMDGEPITGDTMVICTNGCTTGPLSLQWYVDGAPWEPQGDINMVTGGLLCGIPYSGPITDQITWFLPGNIGADWVTLETIAILDNGPCGSDQLVFTFTDSIFLVPVEPPSFTLPEDRIICQGDTLQLFLHDPIQCDSVDWLGPGIVAISGTPDTAWVNAAGTYSFVAIRDTLGVYCRETGMIQVIGPPIPVLLADPPDATVCPGDAVTFSTTTPGSGFLWFGPDGALDEDGPSITVSQPGEYFVSLTDTSGCSVASTFMELAFFGSPFLDIGAHDGILCPGESLFLTAVAAPGATVQWAPPLTGNAFTQVIDAPGTYTAFITQCGLVHVRNITIAGGTPQADVADPGPFLICPGEQLVLQGLGSPGEWTWLPEGVPGAQLQVQGSGSYQFQVVDDHGCVAVSDPVLVDVQSFLQPLAVQDTALCAGEPFTVMATGSGTIIWFFDAALQDTAAVGPLFSAPGLNNDLLLFVTQSEGACTVTVPVMVSVVAQPVPPAIDVPGTLCLGASLQLTMPGDWDAVNWTTPQGPVEGPSLVVQPLGYADAGTYTVSVIMDGCAGGSQAWTMDVELCGLEVPNIFTPNGDGVNDVLFIEAPEGTRLGFEVVNRWGQRVAVLQGRIIAWDGRNMMAGTQLSDGTYFYVLTIEPSIGPVERRQGYITLVR